MCSCTTNNINKTHKKNIIPVVTFTNKGFTLVFSENLRKEKKINKKIEYRSLIIFQKNLKNGTGVKITNLLNNKSILVKVGENSKYPNFYNSVISKRIFDAPTLGDPKLVRKSSRWKVTSNVPSGKLIPSIFFISSCRR